MEGAWDIEKGKQFVRVGVYDTGVDQLHYDLNAGKVVDGFNYFANSALSAVFDTDDHGTAVAGIIGAYRNNNNCIAGIAGGDNLVGNPGVSIVDCKIAKDATTFTGMNTIANAMNAGAISAPTGYGLHVMNHSWADQTGSKTLHDALQNVDQNGVVVVASRGNFPDITPIDKAIYPSCYQDEMVISVGASGRDGDWKQPGNGNPGDALDDNYSSMTKRNVDMIAPGTNTVVRTVKAQTANGFRMFDGTSAAAPHVSGMAALMCSYVDNPTPVLANLAIEDVENILQMSCVDKQAPGYDDNAGWGLVNATAAMNMIKQPKYKIQHFGVGQNASSSVQSNKILTQAQIVLVSSYGGLAAGTYFADVYENIITLNYNMGPNDVIITSWPRFSSTFGWSAANPQNTDNFCQIISVTPTKAILKTWTYNFKYDQNGNVLVDPLYPTQYGVKAALSIYTYDQSIVGVKEISADGTQMYNLYPNPSNNNTTVIFTLLDTKDIELALFDTQGKLIKTIEKGRAVKGTHEIEISTSDLAEGIYYCRLTTDKASCGKKLVVVK